MNQEIICGSVVVMKCNIIWNKLGLDEWQNRFASIKHSNILQSYPYAQAFAKTYGQKARWGLIMMGDKEAGLVQIIESSLLFGAVHGLMLDRGPLWFDGFGGAAHIKLFFDEINKEFPRRVGRKRRVLPEIDMGGAIEQIIRQCGFEKKPEIQAYQTIWWDLNEPDELARAGLKSNWRGSLKKSENAGLEVKWEKLQESSVEAFTEFKLHYIQDKVSKGYTGISPKLLNNLALFSTQANPMILGKVKLNDEVIAGVLFLTHGQCATYQIGWSSEIGRLNCAHHLLLWRGRQILKEHNIHMLDLGGINDHDDTQKGLSSFKRGIGGKEIELAGHYF